jgi:hypothetical protein
MNKEEIKQEGQKSAEITAVVPETEEKEAPEMQEQNSDTPPEQEETKDAPKVLTPEEEAKKKAEDEKKKIEAERATHTVAEGIFNVIKDISATKGKCFLDELEDELLSRYESTFKFVKHLDRKKCTIIFPVIEALVEFKVISFNMGNPNNPAFLCVEDKFAAADYLPHAEKAILTHNHVQNLQKQA